MLSVAHLKRYPPR